MRLAENPPMLESRRKTHITLSIKHFVPWFATPPDTISMKMFGCKDFRPDSRNAHTHTCQKKHTQPNEKVRKR